MSSAGIGKVTVVVVLAAVVLLVGVLWFLSPGLRSVVTKPSPDQVKQELGASFKVTGKAVAGEESDWSFRGQKWDVDFTLDNRASFPTTLGRDTVLIESNTSGGSFDGVVVVRAEEPRSTLDLSSAADYPLDDCYSVSNFYIYFTDGNQLFRKGGMTGYTTSVGRSSPENTEGYGSLKAGEKRPLKISFSEGTWVRPEYLNSLRVALPELQVESSTGTVRHRLVAYLQKKSDAEWTVDRTELIPMEPDPLKKLVAVPETNLGTRVLAANWLSQIDPKAAKEVLVKAGENLREGGMLASCLALLARTKGDGLGPSALKLLQDNSAPNGIRHLSAKYLGAVKYQPAFDALVAAAKVDDSSVVSGAIQGLGLMGGDKASAALIAMAETEGSSNVGPAMRALARTRTRAGLDFLERQAKAGKEEALSALAREAAPESYNFLVDTLRARPEQSQKADLMSAIRISGGEKSGPFFMEMIAKDPPPTEAEPFSTTPAVNQLITLKSEKLRPELEKLARANNHRALQALAGYDTEAANGAVVDIARKSSGVGQAIALNAVSINCPEGNLSLFEPVIKNPTANLFPSAARAFRKADEERAKEVLLPITNHKEQAIRRTAAGELSRMKPGKSADGYLKAVLATQDDQVRADLVSALLEDNWADKKAVPQLKAQLGKDKENDAKFQVIRLLRRLSKDAMGPETYFEFNNEPDKWVEKWKAWTPAS